ncbi:MAG: molybdopterin-dependent oxidoreductase, partial [Neisseriaceae bacterium]|nr:molybdopterin-dependent oxidoreductase [Neisseriaceae bacterium]
KPFRYDARSWELSRRKSISAHDGLGSNLIVQVKDHLVRRVLPLTNEAINECWLSDRDRFAYEGLNHTDRLTVPMIKQDGQWVTVDWDVALNYVVSSLNGVAADYGKESIGFLLSPQSTNEELFLAANLAREFGVNNIDSRLRQSDFSADVLRTGATWLGGDITDLAEATSIFVIGSSLRSEHPLLAARLRAAVKKGSSLNLLHAADDDLLCEVNAKLIHQPVAWVSALNGVLQVVLSSTKGSSTQLKLETLASGVCEQTKSIAASLLKARTTEKPAFIVMGEVAQQHPEYAKLHALCQELARLTGAHFGVLAVAANSVGAQVVGALPLNGGLNAREMLTQPRKSYFLLNTEIEYDAYSPTEAIAAMKSAQSVIALTAYKSENLLDYADVLLPITPFTETAGSFVNMAGAMQSFNGVVRPLGQARPAWKVLRVLANLMDLPNFDYDNVEAIRSVFAPCDIKRTLNNQYNDLHTLSLSTAVSRIGLQRLGEVPMFSKDSITRRATALQKTIHAIPSKAYLHSETLTEQGFQCGDLVVIKQGNGSVQLHVKADDTLAKNTIRLAAAKAETLVLSGLFDPLFLEKGV